MKKIVSIILAELLLLCSLMASATSTEEIVPYTGIQENQYLLDMKMGDHILWEWSEEYLLCQAEWNSLLLTNESADAFPKLAQALEKMNLDKLLAMQDEMAWMLPIARDVANEYMYCTSESEYYVQRADSRILSVKESVYSFTGGAHPNHGMVGINFDPESGEELKLSNVVVDVAAIMDAAAKVIIEKYGEYLPTDEVLSAIKSLSEEEIEWTLSYEGITFYFSPGMIAPYAAGQMNVTIWFDEHAELVKAEYLTASSVMYAMKLPLFEAVEVDLIPDDGKRDEIIVYAYENAEDGRILDMFCVNGEEVIVSEYEAYYAEPYLVTIKQGSVEHNFLYIQERYDNDSRAIHIYDLSSGKPEECGIMPDAGFTSEWDMEREASYSTVFNDPCDFQMGTQLDLFGWATGVKTYTINEHTGYPIPKEDYYDLSDVEMISLLEIKTQLLPDGEDVILSVGEKISFLRTDGYSYVDGAAEDGCEYRFVITWDDNVCMIDGKDCWDCFVEAMYYED